MDVIFSFLFGFCNQFVNIWVDLPGANKTHLRLDQYLINVNCLYFLNCIIYCLTGADTALSLPLILGSLILWRILWNLTGIHGQTQAVCDASKEQNCCQRHLHATVEMSVMACGDVSTVVTTCHFYFWHVVKVKSQTNYFTYFSELQCFYWKCTVINHISYV